MIERDELKRQAAERAVDFVEPGMVVGLGHGTTARFALLRLADLLASGRLRGVVGVPCSLQVQREARRLGIPLTTLGRHPQVDLTIDGADEVDPDLSLIKGGGGALLREKIVAQATRREVIVVDESKMSPALGTRSPLPVEVIEFGWQSQADFLRSLGAPVELRQADSGGPFRTQDGNLLLDCRFGAIPDPAALALALGRRAGIVEHGLFLGIASDVIVAGPEGLRHLTPEGPSP